MMTKCNGFRGELAIKRWLESKGCMISGWQQKCPGDAKGPRMFLPSLIPKALEVRLADFVLTKNGQTIFFELKTKTQWSRYRNRGDELQQGMDANCWSDYKSTSQLPNMQFYIGFLVVGEQDTNNRGLWGEDAGLLSTKIDHGIPPNYHQHAPSGMVYWSQSVLKRWANWEQIESFWIEAGRVFSDSR